MVHILFLTDSQNFNPTKYKIHEYPLYGICPLQLLQAMITPVTKGVKINDQYND